MEQEAVKVQEFSYPTNEGGDMRVFYSTVPGLMLNFYPKSELAKDRKQRDPITLEFARYIAGNGYNFGYYSTNDPEKIEFLSKHRDVFGPDKLNELITPPEVRERMAHARAQQLEREITAQNALIAELKRKVPVREGAASQK